MMPHYEEDALHQGELPHDMLSTIVPEDRIYEPIPNHSRKRLMRLAIAGLAGAAAYALTTAHPNWYQAVREQAAALREIATNERAVAGGDIPPQNAPSRPESLAQATPPEMTQLADEHPSAPEVDVSPRTIDETPIAAATVYTHDAEQITPAPEQAAVRARATKAGLGPDLPNVLLVRLNKADLENAAYAIKTALSKTPEHTTLRWPPKPSAMQALFEVRFVAGAPDGCRRYVVTVTKEHWTTTSGAVETCKRDETP